MGGVGCVCVAGWVLGFPTSRLLDLLVCWFFGVVVGAGGAPLLLGVWKRGGERGWCSPAVDAGRVHSLGLAYRRGKEAASAQAGGQVRVRGGWIRAAGKRGRGAAGW